MLVFFTQVTAFSQSFDLVKDFSGITLSQNIANYCKSNGQLFFTIDYTQLWKTDGTDVGTLLIKDFGTYGYVTGLFDFNGRVYFAGSEDTLSGVELWVSDGTLIGTYMIKDIYTGSFGSYPTPRLIFQNALFFVARDSINTQNLWKTDGTNPGTVLVKNFGYNGQIGNMIANDSFIYLNHFDTIYGRELWISNGTGNGTLLFKDIYPGASSSNPWGFEFFGDTLIFYAKDNISGGELWMTDGTIAGTVLLSDIFPGSTSSEPQNFMKCGNKYFFSAFNSSAGRELWVYDHSSDSIRFVKDINPGSGSSSPYMMATNDSIIFMNAYTSTNGNEIWVSNGTENGTYLLKDIIPGPDSYYNLGYEMSLMFRDTLYFINKDEHQAEIWRTTGDSLSTVRISDIHPQNQFLVGKGMVDLDSTFLIATSFGGIQNGISMYKMENCKRVFYNEGNGFYNVCLGDSLVLDVNFSGIVNWLDTSYYGNIIGAGNPFITPYISSDTCFYVQDSGCSSSNGKTEFIIDVTSISASIFQQTTYLFTTAMSGYTFQWVDCDNNYAPFSGQTNYIFLLPNGNGNYGCIVSYNGCSDTTNCLLISGVDISQFNELLSLSVSPNPTTGIVEVSFTAPFKYEIFDPTGKIHLSGNSQTNSEKIECSSLSRGIYFIQINSSNINTCKKFIKQ